MNSGHFQWIEKALICSRRIDKSGGKCLGFINPRRVGTEIAVDFPIDYSFFTAEDQ